jgi:hypothetical protein
LQEIYLEKLAEISAQVEDRKFVMENEEKQEQDDMRSMYTSSLFSLFTPPFPRTSSLVMEQNRVYKYIRIL